MRPIREVRKLWSVLGVDFESLDGRGLEHRGPFADERSQRLHTDLPGEPAAKLELLPAIPAGHRRQRVGHAPAVEHVRVELPGRDGKRIVFGHPRERNLGADEASPVALPIFFDEIGVGEAGRVLVRVCTDGAVQGVVLVDHQVP